MARISVTLNIVCGEFESLIWELVKSTREGIISHYLALHSKKKKTMSAIGIGLIRHVTFVMRLARKVHYVFVNLI